MKLSKEAEFCISMLENAGFEAYAVGGCVRDCLLGTEPFDYDVTTSAKPDEMKAVFKNEHVIETGLKHGTLTVLENRNAVEITTFRVDKEYLDGRHPSGIGFAATLSEDLARRDFTVNAIAYNEKTGIIDVFGGISDLEHGIIRCVGDPDKRFGEDALRIIRALRFASCLGFSIEEKTAESIIKNRKLLEKVSAERISSELSKLLCGKDAARILLDFREVFFVLIPEMEKLSGFDQHHFRHYLDAFEHTAKVVESVPPEKNLRLAALLHDIAKPRCFSMDENKTGHFYGHAPLGAKIAEEILSDLKYDNETKKQVCELIRRHGDRFEPTPKAIKRLLGKIGPEAFENLLLLMEGDDMAKRQEYRNPPEFFENYRRIALEIIEKKECFSVKDLAVNGTDLIAAGISPGPEMGKILDDLLEMVIDGKIPNEKTALLEYIKNRK